MNVLGVFRGFPGLGRVVSGVSILEILKDEYGFDIKAISYLQGNIYLKNNGYIVENEATELDYSSIGLVPTNRMAEYIRQTIESFSPNLVIVDGEPLMVHSLRISYPNLVIVALLNPSDIENHNNDQEAMKYFNTLYAYSDLAIVHGGRAVNSKDGYRRILSIPTIIRPEILSIKNNPQKKIYCILGGGTVNVGARFVESTLQIGSLCISVAKEFPDYMFVIVCSSNNIYKALSALNMHENVLVVDDIMSAREYYSDASLVFTRSGRNTIGEVAYLGIPTISFVSGCEYRQAEQQANIENLRADNIRCAHTTISISALVGMMRDVLGKNTFYTPKIGNELAIQALLSLLTDYNN